MGITRRRFLGALGLAACSRPWIPHGGVADGSTVPPSTELEGGLTFPDGARFALWSRGRIGVWSLDDTPMLQAVAMVSPPALAHTYTGVIGAVVTGPTSMLCVTDHGSWSAASAIDLERGSAELLAKLPRIERIVGSPERLVAGATVYDTATMKPRLQLPAPPIDAAFLADGRHLAVASAREVTLIELATGASFATLPDTGGTRLVAAHPRDPRVYTVRDRNGEIVMHDLGSGEARALLPKVDIARWITAFADDTVAVCSSSTIDLIGAEWKRGTVMGNIRSALQPGGILVVDTYCGRVDLRTAEVTPLPIRYADHRGRA